mmetsp:Transcript_21186/g.61139  ORF Transcript_21186/g.61139 Transcript_21186/m.61139 type:complete len:222 (-) Transcript_21186:1258-1923(-)
MGRSSGHPRQAPCPGRAVRMRASSAPRTPSEDCPLVWDGGRQIPHRLRADSAPDQHLPRSDPQYRMAAQARLRGANGRGLLARPRAGSERVLRGPRVICEGQGPGCGAPATEVPDHAWRGWRPHAGGRRQARPRASRPRRRGDTPDDGDERWPRGRCWCPHAPDVPHGRGHAPCSGRQRRPRAGYHGGRAGAPGGPRPADVPAGSSLARGEEPPVEGQGAL